MATTVSQIVFDALPRLGVKPTGTTLYQAINLVATMIGKRLMNRRSELLSVVETTWTVKPGNQYYLLPPGFVSLRERPASVGQRAIDQIERHRSAYDGQTAMYPKAYELLGQQIVFYPALDPNAVSVDVTARYYALPSQVVTPTGIIPFNGMFDQVFFQGVPRVVVKGLAVVQADQDFEAFLNTEVDALISARSVPAPGVRMKRRSFL